MVAEVMTKEEIIEQLTMMKMSHGAIFEHRENLCNEVITETIKLISYSRHDGEWLNFTARIDKSYVGFKCSSCGDLELIASNYCPYCGAKMRNAMPISSITGVLK